MIKGFEESWLGCIEICVEDSEITAVRWPSTGQATGAVDPVLASAKQQIAAYFSGDLTVFDLPLRLGPSAFQAAFQRALLAIPFGETRTYGELARELGAPAQAIGQACGANGLPLIVPCHRVLGGSGLGGFSGGGGVHSKAKLLRHEGVLLI